jgi:hypothetical protein
LSQLHIARNPADTDEHEVVLARGACVGLHADAVCGLRRIVERAGPVRTMSPNMETTPGYAFGLGLRGKRAGVEAGVQLHDTLTTASLEFRMRVLKTRFIAADMHFGPAAGMLVVDDEMLLPPQFGQGFRLGVGLAGTVGPLNAFADVYVMDIGFLGDGPAAGFSSMTGLTLGFALR